MNVIHKTTWHGFDAWALESEAMRVVIVPELGAKIVSLFDKLAAYEWLVAPMRPPRAVKYGAIFVEQDMSGWDEMMPTIDACAYPVPGAYANRDLPDHGEVWSLSWTRDESNDEVLSFSVHGRALPYHLQRKTALIHADTIRFEYQVTNRGAESLYYLWAAHPQFKGAAETIIILPPVVTEVYNVGVGRQWNQAGIRLPWPTAVGADGTRWQLDHIYPTSRRDCRKFYVPPEIQVSWAKLFNSRAGSTLRLAWGSDQVPYLGIWVDEGVYNSAPVVALEPSNGFYDNLAQAYMNGRVARLEPGAVHRWILDVSTTQVHPENTARSFTYP